MKKRPGLIVSLLIFTSVLPVMSYADLRCNEASGVSVEYPEGMGGAVVTTLTDFEVEVGNCSSTPTLGLSARGQEVAVSSCSQSPGSFDGGYVVTLYTGGVTGKHTAKVEKVSFEAKETELVATLVCDR